MNEVERQKLKRRLRTWCAKCKSVISSTNPVKRCFHCRKKYCFDHLWGGYLPPGWKDEWEIQNICDDCKSSHPTGNFIH